MIAKTKWSAPIRWGVVLGVVMVTAGLLVVRFSGSSKVTTEQTISATVNADRFLPDGEFCLEGSRRMIWIGQAGGDFAMGIAGLRDRKRSLAERLSFARQLALLGTPAAMRALLDAYLSGSPSEQQALAGILVSANRKAFQAALLDVLESGTDAEAASVIRGVAILGGTENFARLTDIMNDPAWPDCLRGEAAQALLRTGDDHLCRLAIRGMGAIGTQAETSALAAILHNSALSQSLRIEAAVALGRIASPSAGDELIAAFAEFADEVAQAVLLDALGHFPFPRIAGTWKIFLDDPSTSPELRSSAVEALANSTPEAVSYLTSLAAMDRDADVREMAAWALSTQEPGGTLGLRIADMLHVEPEADVRRRLYEGLLVQAENPAASLLSLICQEEDPAARVAGMNAVGDAIGRGASSSLSSCFDSQMVPELQSVALGNSSLNLRMRAVFALRRAGTPASTNALTLISRTSAPEIATAALHGLQASK